MSLDINLQARLIASAIHFSVTLLVTGIMGAIIFLVWFPGTFAEMVGGSQLFFLVVCSDLVLGPLISLVIFNTKKSSKELIADYVVIGAVQLGALIYGVSAVAVSRPVVVAFVVDRFEVVSALELDDTDLEKAVDPQYRSRSWFGPRLVSVQLPTDADERKSLMFSALAGKDAHLMPKYYRPYEVVIDGIKKGSATLDKLSSKHPEKRQELEAAIKASGRTPEELRWLPMHHRFGFWTALIDVTTGYPIKYLPIDPY